MSTRARGPWVEVEPVRPDELGYELLVRFPGNLDLWRREGRYALTEARPDGSTTVSVDLDWPEARRRIRVALGDGRLARP